MSWNQISKRWRKNLVQKLQERYGLAEQEAVQKIDAWLQRIGNPQGPPPHTLTAEVLDQRASSRQAALMRPGKSRSRAAGRS